MATKHPRAIKTHATLTYRVEGDVHGFRPLARAVGSKAGYNVDVIFDGQVQITQKCRGWWLTAKFEAAQLKLISFDGGHLNTRDALKLPYAVAQELGELEPARFTGTHGATIELEIVDNNPVVQFKCVMEPSTPRPDPVANFPLRALGSLFRVIRLDILDVSKIGPCWHRPTLLHFLAGNADYISSADFQGT